MVIDRPMNQTTGSIDTIYTDGARTLFVGDLHGHKRNLKKALDKVDFNFEKDILISVGDLIDRGPDSKALLEQFLETENFLFVRGNHEQMMIKGRTFSDLMLWYTNGGRWSEDVPRNELDKLRHQLTKIPYAMEVEISGRWYGVTHGDIVPEITSWEKLCSMILSGDSFIKENILWARDIIDCPEWFSKPEYTIQEVDYVIHGHTPVEEPMIIGNRIYIDTGAAFGNLLTLLEFVNGEPIFHTMRT